MKPFFFEKRLFFALEWPGLARLHSARLGSASKVSVWYRRDAFFSKKVASGVDETTFAFSNVHLV